MCSYGECKQNFMPHNKHISFILFDSVMCMLTVLIIYGYFWFFDKKITIYLTCSSLLNYYFSWVLVIWRVDAITRHRIRECTENFQMVQRVNLFAIYMRIQLCWIISEISDFSQTNSFAELLKKWKLVIIGAIYGLKSLIFEI